MMTKHPRAPEVFGGVDTDSLTTMPWWPTRLAADSATANFPPRPSITRAYFKEP